MGWVDEQLRQRAKADRDQFHRAFLDLAGVVTGRQVFTDEEAVTRSAVAEICRYFGAEPEELPDGITDFNDQLDYMLRPTGIMRRVVRLEKDWQKEAIGVMLVQTTDGSMAVLLPGSLGGYTFFDKTQGKKVKVTSRNVALMTADAICFYKPLPLKKLGLKDLALYMLQTLHFADFFWIVLANLAVTLVGLTLPYANMIIFSKVLDSGLPSLLLAATVLLVGTTVARLLMSIVNRMLMARIETKLSIAVEAASMMRLLSLPTSFFRQYSSGELASRVQNINSLCSMLSNAVLSVGLTSVFSITYVFQIFRYAPALVRPSLLITALTFVLSLVTTFVQMRIAKKRMESSALEGGMIYSLFSAVQKIKLAGAERRTFAQWAASYKTVAELNYNPPFYYKINSVIGIFVSLAGTIFLYFSAVKSGVSVAEYIAFTAAYGMVSGAFVSLAGIASTVARIKPTLEMVEPILTEVPEVQRGKKIVERVSGSIEINNVSFRYSTDMPYVLDNLSLKIRAGQYVAVVGSTGCGKSTLLRLLLGFEQPEKGAIYYDRNDISTVDLISLRKNIGCVIQNGKLFAGSIFSNIVVSAPWLTMADAWKAAELADIADDIRDMPMGMQTIISEGGGGISGGQKQRLMIARAVVNNPRILMLDEATSALDNITQKKVSDALDSLKCTRIVIAHRLSTIQHCDRIIVLDKGKIAEDGTFDELIAQNGIFAGLVARQRVGKDI
ncbi:MAG: ATP-binding cassette domain-containing protein [Saccharofermentanales bacterium]|jgi:NHLM bacteriocin system ABC transporter ATP-binding protein